MSSRATKIVRVEWVDSTRNGGWHRPSEARDDRDLRCSSVGILVDNTKDEVTVAPNVSWQDGRVNHVCDTMTIPRVAIRKISTIATLDPPKR